LAGWKVELISLRASTSAWIRRHLNEDTLDVALLCVCLLGLIQFAIHGPYGAGDIRVYHRYAIDFWAGKNAFHILPIEYPPLSIVVFSLSVLPPIGDYATVYAFWMAVLFMVGYFAFRRFSSRHNATLYAVYLLLGATGAVLGRFDLFPALLTVAAFWAARRHHFMVAYLLLAAGALLKLYPLALVPVLMIEHRRFPMMSGRTWRLPVVKGAAAVGALVVASLAIGFALEGWNSLSTFYYAAARPLQVESLGATLLWLGSFAGFSAVTEHGWSSYNLVGPLQSGIMALLAFAGLAGLAWVYWRSWLGRLDFGRALLAVICVTLLTSKVFSPQYLIWALPLVVEVEGIDAVWLLICACTTLIYPVLYVNEHIFGTPGPLPYTGTFLGAIAIRNAALIVATARVVLPGRRLAAHPAVEPALQESSVMSISGD
jgi:Glycosyltransferase family 87